MTKKKIGLFGFGCVGQGLYNILKEKDGQAEIVKIAVKDKLKKRDADPALFVYHVDDILNDIEIDIIVELIDDPSTAFEIAKRALSKKIPVVSANKKMIAENLVELIGLQKQHDTPLLYEGAVCGSIPVIQTLKNYYSQDVIKSISGIFNGSSNYILSKITNEGRTYSTALAEAQAHGFAESDPFMDVEGVDSKFKLCILAYHAFGVILNPNDILTMGISALTEDDFLFANKHSLKIKLIAQIHLSDKGFRFIVAPTFIHKTEPLYDIENEENAVVIDTLFTGKQLLTGKGAGSLPTGLAVFSDINALVNNRISLESNKRTNCLLSNDEVLCYLKSYNNTVRYELFSEIREEHIGKDYRYMAGKMSYESLLIANTDLKKSTILFSQKAYNQLLNENTYRYA